MVNLADGVDPAPDSSGKELGSGREAFPEVSIVLPHFNDHENLGKCLAALKAQSFGRGRFEVIIADNMSDGGLDPVRKVAGDFATVVAAPIRGPGPARNAGAAAARGAILAFTDTDCDPSPAWLEEGVKLLGRFDVVGGAMRVTFGDPENPTGVECFERVFAFNNDRAIEKDGYTVTANLLTRRSVFEKVGGFADQTVWEDIDWCRRAARAGFTLGYAPGALVSHPARRTWAQLQAKTRRVSHHAYVQNAMDGKGKAYWAARNFAVLLSPLGQMFQVLTSDRLDTWSQKFSAIRILYAIRIWRFFEGLRILSNAAGDDPWAGDRAQRKSSQT